MFRVDLFAHTDSANNMVEAEHRLSSWGSGSLVPARHRVSTWPVPHQNPEHWVSKELPWLITFHTCCHYWLLEKLAWLLHDFIGRGSQKLVPGFLQTSPHAPFSFADYIFTHNLFLMKICYIYYSVTWVFYKLRIFPCQYIRIGCSS